VIGSLLGVSGWGSWRYYSYITGIAKHGVWDGIQKSVWAMDK
jgi:hypothetical protein